MRVLRISLPVVGLVTSAWLAACTPATPAPEAPVEPASAPPEQSAPPQPSPDEGAAEDSENPPPAPTSTVPEPQFAENSSVDQAIKAVPPGAETRNIDPETLGKPLQNVALYEPCKPGNARVKMRVAVWDGKAVGIDITTTPKNDKLADCIKTKIREITWEKKVKSLNTIEYQF
jgi:hypothetical protein